MDEIVTELTSLFSLSLSLQVCLRDNTNLEGAGFSTMQEENYFFSVLLADMEKRIRVPLRVSCCKGSEKLFNSKVHLLYFKGRVIKRSL